MWILKWLPDWIFYATLLLGLAALVVTYFLRFIPIPLLWTYKIPVQVVAIFIVAGSVYMLGAQANDQHWQALVKEAEAKVKLLEAKSQEQNVKVVERVLYRDKVIREKAETVVKYVDREVVKYDTQCIIPNEFQQAHNEAARGKE